MEANNYFSAQFPVPYTILGLRLKPFCLGHYTLLAHPAIGCAFVSETSVIPTVADLLIGVLICSKTYEESKAFIESEYFALEIEDWGCKCGAFDLVEKLKLFKAYIDEGSEMPKFIELDDEPRRETGSHWTQAVKLTLTAHLGYSETVAMNMPLTQAFADHFKYAEAQGLVRMMTAEEMNEDFVGGSLNGFDSELPEVVK